MGSWFSDRTVRTKVLAIVLVGAAATLTVGLVRLHSGSVLAARSQQIYEARTRPLATLGMVEAAGLRARLDMLDHILNTTVGGQNKFATAIDAEAADITKMMATIDPSTLDTAAKEHLSTFNA